MYNLKIFLNFSLKTNFVVNLLKVHSSRRIRRSSCIFNYYEITFKKKR